MVKEIGIQARTCISVGITRFPGHVNLLLDRYVMTRAHGEVYLLVHTCRHWA